MKRSPVRGLGLSAPAISIGRRVMLAWAVALAVGLAVGLAVARYIGL
jgi:hypothetical protein